ncbi:sortase [candidate division WWE3 bacterium]|jgi:sortase A|uniref:Sortase n=1 Tax=candidate division WWE3 bacterium TaxID=2053526 RepID=A0A3A4ZG17_UNCKA|nr:MAG: sortase [candidate division WWE3 bacterium]
MPNLLILVGISLIVLSLGPLVIDEVWYKIKEAKDQEYFLDPELTESTESTRSLTGMPVGDSVFSRFLSTRPVLINPVNRDFALVIEKIGINAPVVANVLVTDKDAYNDALKRGVAHALVSETPSEESGNVYLFAHASLNFWNLGKYATTFNLLRKLDNNDRIYLFYKNRIFVYSVVNKEVLRGWNTYPLTRAVIEPILTLQTCDPPGTTLNRLVVTAKLVDIQD